MDKILLIYLFHLSSFFITDYNLKELHIMQKYF